MSDRRSVEIALLAMWKPLAQVTSGDPNRTMELVREHYLAFDLLAHEIVTGARAPAKLTTVAETEEGWYTVEKVEDSSEKVRVKVDQQVGNRGWFTVWKKDAPIDTDQVRKGARIRGTLKHDGGAYWSLRSPEVAV